MSAQPLILEHTDSARRTSRCRSLIAVLWLCCGLFASGATLGSGLIVPATVPSVPAVEANSNPAKVAYLLLVYDATLAGATAGTATIAVMRDSQGYRIVGQAKALGLLEAFNPWRSEFRAQGLWFEGAPAPQRFEYNERGSSKRRQVEVSDGRLRVVKNGKQRPERPAFAGVDVLAALFGSARCENSLEMHTGRHGYRLIARGEQSVVDAVHCDYRVVDEDQQTFDTQIQYAQVDGQRVPERIEISGPLNGVLSLRKSSAHNGRCSSQARAPLDYFCSAATTPEQSPASS